MTKNNEKKLKCIENIINYLAGSNIELLKQLKHKEYESNQFKELYNYYAFDRRKPSNIEELKICINGVNEELIRVQQENEELKEINQELLKYRKHSTTCQECYEDGLEDGKTSNKELRKLRKTLAEIKEIAMDETYIGFWDEQISSILKKINEVIDD